MHRVLPVDARSNVVGYVAAKSPIYFVQSFASAWMMFARPDELSCE